MAGINLNVSFKFTLSIFFVIEYFVHLQFCNVCRSLSIGGLLIYFLKWVRC